MFSDRWRPRVNPLTEVALTAFCLGVATAFALGCIGAHWFYGASAWVYAFGAYLFCVVGMFHMLEFLVAAEFRPHDATPRSFMIFHSKAYLIASAAGWFEFLVCGWLFGLSYHPAPTTLTVTFGAVLCIGFYMVRVVAMMQCGSNFALLVETRKRSAHQLVTDGLYGTLRHPSYFGWFWYTLATQIVSSNPVCFVLFAAASWKFFKDRIADEEKILRSEGFFGAAYDDYCRKTIVGIPFV